MAENLRFMIIIAIKQGMNDRTKGIDLTSSGPLTALRATANGPNVAEFITQLLSKSKNGNRQIRALPSVIRYRL